MNKMLFAFVAFVACVVVWADSFYLPVRDFEFYGIWQLDDQGNLMYNQESEGQSDAKTFVVLPAGDYTFWVQARDFNTNTGSRRFKLGVNEELFPHEAGAHGYNGLKWESVGQASLKAGEHYLFLRNVSRYSRCKAVFIADRKTIDPNNLTVAELESWRLKITPAEFKGIKSRLFGETFRIPTGSREKILASLNGPSGKIEFVVVDDAAGSERIFRRVKVMTSTGEERILPFDIDGEKLFVLCYPGKMLDRKRHLGGIAMDWEAGGLSRSLAHFPYLPSMQVETKNPFYAGALKELQLYRVENISADTVRSYYRNRDKNIQAVADWTLAAGSLIKLKVCFPAPADGIYSIGFLAGSSFRREQVAAVQCPPLWQYRRVPITPELVPCAMTPNMLNLVEVKDAGGDFTFGVCADPEKIPFEWQSYPKSLYGFCLVNPDDLRVQPSIFSPVAALDNSTFKRGEAVSGSFLLYAQSGTWEQAFSEINNQVFKVRDYRKPVYASLTDAVLNMFDLLNDFDASGFDPRLKGHWNIEFVSMVTNSAPLMPLSAALLSRDETLFRQVALPIYEYTLTRAANHSWSFWNTEKGTRAGNVSKLEICPSYFGPFIYSGFIILFDHLNPYLRDFAFPQGQISTTPIAWGLPSWAIELSVYRVTRDPELLKRIQKEVDRYIARMTSDKTIPLAPTRFYNVHFYPYAWDFLELYELTGQKRYLDAMVECGYQIMAGIWSLPMIPDRNVTVNDDDLKWGESVLLYKGDKPFRLGYPIKPDSVKPKQLPAWIVSNVGLGFEQPLTYYDITRARNVMMSTWTPELLRLSFYTGNRLFKTFARNGIIGRFGNYPGYYSSGYSDIWQRQDYPYCGPDITGIYYHHIPVHLMFTIDYLFTQAFARSQGKVNFPYVKQSAYAYFNNRVYGMSGGTIYDFKNVRPLIRRGIVDPGKDIDWLAGNSDHRFFLVLMSQADHEMPLRLNLQADKCGIDTKAQVTVYVNGKKETVDFNALDRLTVPAEGIVVLAFQARYADPLKPGLLPVKNGLKRKRLNGEWGEAAVFRTRGEFGTDAIYGVITGGFKNKGYKFELFVAGMPSRKPVTTFPFEDTVYPFPIDRDAEVELRLSGPDGKVVESVKFTMGR